MRKPGLQVAIQRRNIWPLVAAKPTQELSKLPQHRSTWLWSNPKVDLPSSRLPGQAVDDSPKIFKVNPTPLRRLKLQDAFSSVNVL